jgi:hypothetical protein
VAAEVDRLETEYDKHRLAQLITSGGMEGGPAFPPAHDETPGKAARESSGGAAETSGEAQNKAQPS